MTTIPDHEPSGRLRGPHTRPISRSDLEPGEAPFHGDLAVPVVYRHPAVNALAVSKRARSRGLSIAVLAMMCGGALSGRTLGTDGFRMHAAGPPVAEKWLFEKITASAAPGMFLTTPKHEEQTSTAVSIEQACTTSPCIELARSCERVGSSNGDACRLLGDLYSEGRLTPKDPGRAEEYWKKACGLRNGSGCNKAGISARGSSRVAEAALLFKKACALDVAEGCWNVGVLMGPTEEALTFFEDACSRGLTAGCEQLRETIPEVHFAHPSREAEWLCRVLQIYPSPSPLRDRLVSLGAIAVKPMTASLTTLAKRWSTPESLKSYNDRKAFGARPGPRTFDGQRTVTVSVPPMNREEVAAVFFCLTLGRLQAKSALPAIQAVYSYSEPIRVHAADLMSVVIRALR